MCYNTAQHPEIVCKMREELDHHLHQRRMPIFDDMLSLEYLNMVCMDALLLFFGAGCMFWWLHNGTQVLLSGGVGR